MIELKTKYQEAKPFPHIVIDDFLIPKDEISSLEEAINTTDKIIKWNADPHDDQINKRWCNDLKGMPAIAEEILGGLNSQSFLNYLSELTGIPDLIADDSYLGGGIHSMGTGGKLSVHADFNIHPVTKLHRRINLLLFLNSNWDPAWNGNLELWEKDMSKCAVEIAPIINRAVIFTITDDAFHGVPKPILCPPGRKRYSLATYYYSKERPEEEKAPFHWANWQRT